MLFDLRGRGRRRTVRVLYIGLALLMGVGLVGFGVGGLGGGGILNSLSEGGSGGGSASHSSEIKKYRKLIHEQPNNASAWEKLAKAIYHEAGNEPYTTSAGAVTSKGKELFKQVSQAWIGYIALNPPKPNAELAQLMESVYGEAGLNESAKEVEVLQIAVAARPTDAALYASLAEYAYKAKNTRIGDLASEKAVAFAPAAQRKQLKAELAELKKNPSPSSSETLTATSGGKTYKVKSNGNGSFTGTPATTTTTTAPKGGSSPTTKK